MVKCDFCRYSIPTDKGFVCIKPEPPRYNYTPYILNTPPWTPPQPESQIPPYDPYVYCTEAIELMSKVIKNN